MEKFKNYLIVFLLLIVAISAIVGKRSVNTHEGEKQAFRDSLALYKFQKTQSDIKIRKLEGDKKILVIAVDSIHGLQVATVAKGKAEVARITKYKAPQVDSLLVAEYPVAPDSADATPLVIPAWRVQAAEIDIAEGRTAKVLNAELRAEIDVKDQIIGDDTEIIAELKAKDSISTKQLAVQEALFKLQTKDLCKEVKRQRFRVIKVVVGSAIIWTLTVAALK